MIQYIFRFGLILTFFTFTVGCASLGQKWKEFITGKSEQQKNFKSRSYGATFNQQNNMMASQHRNYKRVKRKDIEDEAQLSGRAGSLWVMEGQGAYLFSQNIVRQIGDPLPVAIEGEPSEQLNGKAKVISKLLSQLEARRRKAMGRAPAAAGKKEDKGKADAKGADAAKPEEKADAAEKVSGDDAENAFNVKTVPTRVVERTVDGNYRVRGTQPFMIGQREYKVIVNGIVRAEDFSESGVSASQLLDSSFDIVSSRSSEVH